MVVWCQRPDGPFVYEVEGFADPGETSKKQIEEIAQKLHDRIEGAPPGGDVAQRGRLSQGASSPSTDFIAPSPLDQFSHGSGCEEVAIVERPAEASIGRATRRHANACSHMESAEESGEDGL
jgi:hypothetical protein